MKNQRRSKKQSHRLPMRAITTAILVDGGFYRQRALRLFGKKTPEDRANELAKYCRRHIVASQASLYRVFYYDCPPSEKVVFHPLTGEHVNLAKSDQYRWVQTFHQQLVLKRKFAFRRGEELESQSHFSLKYDKLKKLCSGKSSVSDLKPEDFDLDITQKGVDMRIGLDIASLAERRLVNQIVMISGDSDFVPAAKHARRSGIDFILDPMWAKITDSLNEHIDGIRECVRAEPQNRNDPLHVEYRSESGKSKLDTCEDDY